MRIIAPLIFPVSIRCITLFVRIFSPFPLSLKTLFLLTAMALPFVAPANAASDYELGVQAYKAQDYELARKYWEDASADGNMSASYNLASILSRGLGGEADQQRALGLYRVAADAGLAVAQHNLALAYYAGNGVEKNNILAQAWWERAARQGHVQAQYNLGALLWNGEGVKRNEAEAIKLFRKASDAGNLQARAFLDSILEQSDAQMSVERLDGPGSNDANPVTNELLQQAREAYLRRDYTQAYDLWKQAETAGSAFASFQLGHLYLAGQGVEQNAQQALQLTQKAADKGLAQAQYELARHYLDGDIVTKNETLALYWMQSAADNKHIKAKDHLEQLR